MIQHGSPISGIDTSDDGRVLTAGYDNQLILWDSATHRATARSLHDHLVNQCAFSPCGQYAASSSSDYTARLWRLPDLRLHSVMAGHEDDVEGIAFHPENPVLATGARDAAIRLFDFSGTLLKTLRGHAADVLSVAWIDGGMGLVSSSDDGTIKHWDVERGALIEDIDLGGVETDTIALSPDGTLFAGNDEGEIILISVASQRRLPAHEAGIKRLIFDARQNMLVSLSYDRTFKLWKWRRGELDIVHSAELPMIVWPRCAAFLDPRRLVFGTFGSSYAVHDMGTGNWHLDHIEDTHGCNAVHEMAGAIYTVGDAGMVCRNGRRLVRMPSLCNFLVPFGDALVTGGQSGEVLDGLTGRTLYHHRSPVNCGTVIAGSDCSKLLVGTYTGEGLVFRAEPHGPVFEREIAMHANAIKGIAASAEAIFSVCADGAAAFHCPDTLERQALICGAHDKIANGCAALPDGRFISVSRDLKLRIWNGDEAEIIETPSRNSIKCVAASPDGTLIAIGNYTGYVGVYSVPERRWLGWDRASASGISSLAKSVDGRFLFSVYDGTAWYLDPSPWKITAAVDCRAPAHPMAGRGTNGHHDKANDEIAGRASSAPVADRGGRRHRLA